MDNRIVLISLASLLSAACGDPDKDDTGPEDPPDDSASETGPSDSDKPDSDPDSDSDTGEGDRDGDGWTVADGDCDDSDPLIHPEAIDRCGDGVDADCDGQDVDCEPRSCSEADLSVYSTGRSQLVGSGLTRAGDLDGDGSMDLMVSAPAWSSEDQDQSGAVLIFHGSSPGSYGPEDATQLITGSWAGWSMPLIFGGDVDGDGLDDLLVGVPHDGAMGSEAGAAHLVLGSSLRGGTDLSLDEADATFHGTSEDDLTGASVDMGGDVNGDGYADILIGAPAADSFGVEDAEGGAFVWHGPVTGVHGVAPCQALYYRDGGDDAGSKVRFAGDVDGDGLEDLLIGADRYRTDEGTAVLVLEPTNGTQNLRDVGVHMMGAGLQDRAAMGLDGGEDIDGDGLDDIAIGAPYEDTAGNQNGAVYVYTHLPTTGRLTQADTILYGTDSACAGYSVDLGDLDADGRADLLIGAYRYEDVGAAHVVFSRPAGSYDLSDADATVVGEHGNADAGLVVRFAGDLDRDGYEDILVGSTEWSEDWDYGGAAYVFFATTLF